MTAPAVTTKTHIKSRSRKAAHPNSILDRQTLLTALDDAGLTIKAAHIDTFYQALHRQHYPDLPTFVANYYINEEESAARIKESSNDNRDNSNSNSNSSNKASSSSTASSRSAEYQSPLKNPVSTKKNRNLHQLPKILLDFLNTTVNLVTVTSIVADSKTSADGSTTKLAIQLHDGQLVETVLMRYNRAVSVSDTDVVSSTNTSTGQARLTSPRASLCVSSQCGCAMGCTFCATGTMGLSGSLSAGEILEQIVHADRILAREWRENQQRKQLLQTGRDRDLNVSQEEPTEKDEQQQQTDTKLNKKKKGKETEKLDMVMVRNVVFMGMGEPMDNYKNVVEACRALIDRRRWNLAHGRVTVSTVGIVSKIRRLTKECPEVSLAVSLHAPNQAMRSAIVPSAKHYPIEDLIEALDGHMMAYLIARKTRLKEKQNANSHKVDFTEAERIKESTRRRAMIEYVMLEGDTSTLKCAHELGKLCENRQLVVNLIPYNQTDVKDKLRCPSEAHMKEFRNIVASYGSFCTIRRTMGADIDSACGQLITLREKKKAKGDGSAALEIVLMGDIEDVVSDRVVKQKTASPRVVGNKSTTTEGNADVDDDSASSTRKVDLEQWIFPLATATAVAAACFLVSSVLVLRQNRR